MTCITPRINLATGAAEFTERHFIGLSVTFDPDGQDYIEVAGTLVGVDPFALDMRTSPRFQLVVDLINEGMKQRQVAALDLSLVGRELQVPNDGICQIVLNSPEALVRDGMMTAREQTLVFDQTWNAASALRSVLDRAMNATGAGFRVEIDPAKPFLGPGEEIEWAAFKNPWSLVQEICDLAGDLDCYFDGVDFVVADASKPSNQTLALSAEDVTEWHMATTRESFANLVTTEYENGTVYSSAQIDGPLSVNEIGACQKIDRIRRAGTTAMAQRRSSAALTRALNRGQEFTIQGTGLPLELRPGATITADLGRAVHVKGQIKSIRFNLSEATTDYRLTNTRRIT